jgi:acetoin utilization deacetylase AcuC-like enzyme
MLDGTRAWMHAVGVAASGNGPALALSRPAGHHATRNQAMGFGLVNFAAAAAAAHLADHPSSHVAILDWDVHHGNGISGIFAEEPRVCYCSTHEDGGFPMTGTDEADRGPCGNCLHLPLTKGASSDEFLGALRGKALPFLLERSSAASLNDAKPPLLLICAGYDALEVDPLATMRLSPADFGAAVRLIIHEFGFPRERVALGLEGGYNLSRKEGMPAALVETCAALVE